MIADVVRVARCPRHGLVLVTVHRATGERVVCEHTSPVGRTHRFRPGSYTVHRVWPLPVVAGG